MYQTYLCIENTINDRLEVKITRRDKIIVINHLRLTTWKRD